MQQTLRGIYENASGDDDRGRDHAHPQSARITPTTRDNTIETWQTTCEAAEDERGRASMPLLARAIQAQASNQSLDAEHSKLRSLEAIQKKGSRWTKTRNGQTARSSRRARRATRPMPGPQDPSRYSHRRPQTHQAIVEQHFRALGRPQAGTNTAPTRRRAMLALIIRGTAGRSRLVQTGNRATNPPARPCLHSINDKAAFDRSINKLANGKTPA
jgi:hypothetical protein